MKKLVLSLLLSVFGLSAAMAQSYNFVRYSLEEGLSRSGVYWLHEDSYGFLWIATEGGGVSIFDGNRFKTLSTEDGLAHNTVRCIFEDSKGRMWFGTEGGGISIFDYTTFNNFDTKDGLTHNVVRCITEDQKGNFWLATLGGGLVVCTYEEGKLKVTQVANDTTGLPSNKCRYLLNDSKGNIWAGTDKGLCKFENMEMTLYTEDDGLADNKVLTVYEDGMKNIWIGTQNGVSHWNGDYFTNKYTWNGLIHNRVKSICQDSYGNIWFGTRMGLSRWDGSHIYSYTENEGLSNNRIRYILNTTSGSLWIGTYFGGIMQYNGDDFIFYSDKDGLASNQVTSILTENDTAWIGSYDGMSILKLRDNMKIRLLAIYANQNGGYPEVITSIEKLMPGLLSIVSEEGYFRFRKKTGAMDTPDTLEGISVSAQLAQNDEHLLWLGSENSLMRLRVDSLDGGLRIEKTMPLIEQALKEHVSCIVAGQEGQIWAGTTDGKLYRVAGDSLLMVMDKGLQVPVSSMLFNADGDLLIGTEGKGIFILDHENLYTTEVTYTHINMSSGLSSELVKSLVLDEYGSIWAGNERGVDKIIFNEKKELAEVKHFGREDGFAGIESNRNATAVQDNGQIWFGTIKGAVRFNPFGKSKNTEPPYTHITGVRLNYLDVNWQESQLCEGTEGRFHLPQKLVLPHDRSHVTFDFTGINLRKPKHVKYKWKLVGFEDEWSVPSKENDVTYSNLPPGQYTFQVMAANEDGKWNENPVSFSFEVSRPYWNTWWFYVLVVIVGGGLFIGVSELRDRQLRRDKRVLEKKVQERTKMIEKQKEEIAGEKEKADQLLLNILPKQTAEELKTYGKATIRKYETVSVLFTDFVGFTKVTEKLSPDKLITGLDEFFGIFDDIVKRWDIEKIKTIGDAYMCAGGIPVANKSNPVRMILAAMEMIKVVKDINTAKKMRKEPIWDLRVGINTGPVIAGVVGKNKFAYDIWGDTVNVASRMESGGENGRINISGDTYKLVSRYFECEFRGKLPAKNKGEVEMYFVNRIKTQYSQPGEKRIPNDIFISIIQDLDEEDIPID